MRLWSRRTAALLRFRPANRAHVAAIAQATPAAMLGHILNTVIAVAALSSEVPWAVLSIWALYSCTVALFVFGKARTVRPRSQSSKRRSINATKRSIVMALALALPWSTLTTCGLGTLAHQHEIIAIALAVGMAAAGSVILAPIPPAAITYMAVILAPVTIKSLFWMGTREDVLFGTLAFSYGMFLLTLTLMSHRIFTEKLRAMSRLESSMMQIRLASEKVEHAAKHDELTKLKNRRALLDDLRQISCSTKNEAFALYYLDIDDFKEVNDSYGHAVGDEVLKQVAGRLQTMVHTSDFIARLGGDEFALVARRDFQAADNEQFAQRLIKCISQPYHVGGQQITIGVGVGIAVPDGSLPDHNELMKMADLALNAAKQGGRNTSRTYEPQLKARLEVKRALECGLRQAIEERQFQLVWQPIVELATGAPAGLEALIRWKHPDRGLISPAEFLPVAEQTGQILKIGEWVVAEACRQAMKWPAIRISVNLSPLQLADDRIIEITRIVLEETGLPPQRLQMEITESALLQDAPEVKQRIERLKALGVTLAMDDFGTGYSSLSYVARYPFDSIKIDRSFVAGVSRYQAADPIIRAITQLAAALGCTTVAEGIETAEQAEYLKKCGAKFGQGYYFSRPIAAELVGDFLAAQVPDGPVVAAA
jgi:diguanylate cyclase (GGDEF)-like protein